MVSTGEFLRNVLTHVGKEGRGIGGREWLRHVTIASLQGFWTVEKYLTRKLGMGKSLLRRNVEVVLMLLLMLEQMLNSAEETRLRRQEQDGRIRSYHHT